MRLKSWRWLSPLALAVAVLAVLGVAQAGATTSSGALVVGSGVHAFPGGTGVAFSFSATTLGALPGGYEGWLTWSHVGSGSSATGVVTCVRVSGKTATLAGVITSGSPDTTLYPGELAGDWFVTTVVDNGPAKNGVSPDTMGYVVFDTAEDWAWYGFPTFVSVCNDPVDAIGDPTQFNLTSGDIKIAAR
jgi:hypothetical protein